jgi:hypothetical protein
MFDKINVFAIVEAHLDTLRSYRTKRAMKRDYTLFFGLPLVASATLVTKNVGLDKDIVANLIAAMSIFSGFLFNLLAIVYSLVDTIKKNLKEDKADKQEEELKRELVKETHGNISYSILISVLLIALLCTTYFLPKFHIDITGKKELLVFDRLHFIGFCSLLIEGMVYFFLMNFGLTLLMILQRIYALMKRRISED